MINEFWTPAPIWRGETVIVVGGGASLRGFDFERLRGHRIIAVNAAGYDLPFADVLFFFDNRWAFENRDLIANWQWLALTASPHACEIASCVRCVDLRLDAPFAVGRSAVKRGRTSGHCAVCVAVAMAAKRVVLLGFDCKVTGARTHYHDRHTEENVGIYANDFAPAWSGYRDGAASVGCEIVNAGPDSALTEFPFVSLAEILGEKP